MNPVQVAHIVGAECAELWQNEKELLVELHTIHAALTNPHVHYDLQGISPDKLSKLEMYLDLVDERDALRALLAERI